LFVLFTAFRSLFVFTFAVEAQRQFNGVEQDLVIDRFAEIKVVRV